MKIFFIALAALISSSVFALDLSVKDIELNQVIQTGRTPLIADRPTMVRVKVGIQGEESVKGIDGLLYVSINGVPVKGSPFYSLNGPLEVTQDSDLNNIDGTLNFLVQVPETDRAEFHVVVNPEGPNRVVEEDYTNNSFIKRNQKFHCRGVVDLPYISVSYADKAGDPEKVTDPRLIEPGIGDGFVRGIFPSADLNYYPATGNSVSWKNINSNSYLLLRHISRYRASLAPSRGQGPQFIYGWLPGNPFRGNGMAIGLPGDAAFGNTQSIRHQRTFAHEIAHLYGHRHTRTTINTIGVDVEHHLLDTENLPMIKPADKRTIMDAGLTTNKAWINQKEYFDQKNSFWKNKAHSCQSQSQPLVNAQRLYHLSGSYDTVTEKVEFDPLMMVFGNEPSKSVSNGMLQLQIRNQAGSIQPQQILKMGSPEALQACDAAGSYRHLPFSVYLPLTIFANDAASLVVMHPNGSEVIGELVKSANAPTIDTVSVNDGDTLRADEAIEWTASDIDRNQLTHRLLWSHDNGLNWAPILVDSKESKAKINMELNPYSKPGQGQLKIMTSDGTNVVQKIIKNLTLRGNHRPQAHLISPNQLSQHQRGANVFFRASGWDAEDRMLKGAQIQWRSNIDGNIGEGRYFSKADLSVGKHTIIVIAQDSAGLVHDDSIEIEIVDRQLPKVITK